MENAFVPSSHSGKTGIPVWIFMTCVGLLCILVGGACDRRVDEMENVFESMQKEERQMRESILVKYPAAREEEIAIQLVKQSASPDGDGAVSNWVQGADVGGGAVFSRWTARRTAMGRYDVRYTFLLVDRDGKVQPVGYSWSADLALQLVYGPRKLTEDELRADWAGKVCQPDSDRATNQPPPL